MGLRMFDCRSLLSWGTFATVSVLLLGCGPDEKVGDGNRDAGLGDTYPARSDADVSDEADADLRSETSDSMERDVADRGGLLANPGFEQSSDSTGCPPNWTCATYRPRGAGEFSTDDEVAHGGGRSGSWSGTGTPGTVMKQRLDSEAGVRYAVSVWVKGEKLQTEPFLQILFDGSDGLISEETFSPGDVPGEWVKITGATSAAPVGTETVRFNLATDDTGGTVWWDDASMTVDSREEPPEGPCTTPGGSSGLGLLGGGAGYGATVTREDATEVVSTAGALESALGDASSGDVVFVEPSATLDMSKVADAVQTPAVEVPAGVTLASNRGVDGSDGALLRLDQEGYLFEVGGDSRVTGLRIEGPSPGSNSTTKFSRGVIVPSGSGIEIDNNEIFGFDHAAVFFNGGEGDVHHNYIHSNSRGGLGYGVSLRTGPATEIRCNYLNTNRHAFAASGEHSGYHAHHNHIGPSSSSHDIDCHATDSGRSCGRVEVNNNIVESDLATFGRNAGARTGTVKFRGAPEEVGLVHHNWFYNPLPPVNEPGGGNTGEAIVQWDEKDEVDQPWENIDTSVFDTNHYGEDASVSFSDIIPGHPGAQATPWRD